MTKYNAPRITSSKKACTCDETGKKINKFESVLIQKTNEGIKVYCKESTKYKLVNGHTHVR